MEGKKEQDEKYLKKFDAQEMADFEEAFDLFDIDGDGTISTTELKNLLRCFGRKATDQDVQNILVKYSKVGESEDIDQDEFKLIMADLMQEPEYDPEITQVYQVFDRENRGVDKYCLQEVMNKLLDLKMNFKENDGIEPDMYRRLSSVSQNSQKHHQITLEEALDIIKEYDLDGDERLNFDEFQKLLMDQSDPKILQNQAEFQ